MNAPDFERWVVDGPNELAQMRVVTETTRRLVAVVMNDAPDAARMLKHARIIAAALELWELVREEHAERFGNFLLVTSEYQKRRRRLADVIEKVEGTLPPLEKTGKSSAPCAKCGGEMTWEEWHKGDPNTNTPPWRGGWKCDTCENCYELGAEHCPF